MEATHRSFVSFIFVLVICIACDLRTTSGDEPSSETKSILVESVDDDLDATSDWPHFRGPRHRITSRFGPPSVAWARNDTPPLRWVYKESGTGYGGPVVSSGHVVMMILRNDREIVVCLDLDTGNELWGTEVGPTVTPPCCCLPGPRSTPTIERDSVFVLGSTGTIMRLRLDDGTVAWKRRMEDFGGRQPAFGFAESPLVSMEHLLLTPGGDRGAIVGLNPRTGELIWQAKQIRGDALYTSIIDLPLVAGSPDRFVQLLSGNLVLFDIHGNLLSSAPWDGHSQWQATSPIPIGPFRVLAIGRSGNAMFKLNAARNDLVTQYQNGKPTTYHHGALVAGNRVLVNNAAMQAMDLETGETVLEQRKSFDRGPLIGNDSWVLAAENKNSLNRADPPRFVLLQPQQNMKVLANFMLPQRSVHASDSKYNGIVTHPVISNDCLFIRDQERLYCFQW
ncbi:MAG: PQQ-binding-like beta-propeller repeat protein [Pirellulaceae bacterium]